MDNLVKRNELTVMKFGGSCIKNKESFNQIIKILNSYKNEDILIVTSSAINGITNKLIEFYEKSCLEDEECNRLIIEIYDLHYNLLNQIIPQDRIEYKDTLKFIRNNIEELSQLGKVIRLIRPSLDIQDLIYSYGERLSTFILTAYLKYNKFNAFYISSDDIILTDDNFGHALPLLDETEKLIQQKLVPLLEQGKFDIICVTGYYGSTYDKKITTLGRGGTDLTAAVLAYSLRNNYNCKVIYWKDVKGLLNADPKISKKTSLLKNLSYVEAKELAFFGSEILHPISLDVNEKGNIPSEIRCFEEPNSEEYTTLSKEIIKQNNVVKAITSIEKLTMVTLESDTMVPLPGTASKLFSLLGDNKINIVFISQSSSENNITFGINYKDSDKVNRLLKNSEFFGKKWFKVKINNNISLVAVIGAGLLDTPGIAGKVFTTLGDNQINIRAIAQGSSDLNFTAIIDRNNCIRAINALYNAFINQS
ncbi:MAG: aspartate kinase [Candidatus Hermodarchaeota archaeon]